MRQTFSVALGASLRGATLPDGSAAQAVQVDNNTGEWLQVYPGATFIAPYTMGWASDFAAPAPSVDILYAPVGPSGQVSTVIGDAITVTLFDADEATADSVGTPYIEGFTPLQRGYYRYSFVPGGPVVTFQSVMTFLGGSTVKRCRLHRIDLLRDDQKYQAMPMPIVGAVTTPTFGTIAELSVAGQRVQDTRMFTPPLDLSPGDEMALSLSNISTAAIPPDLLGPAGGPALTVIVKLAVLVSVI